MERMIRHHICIFMWQRSFRSRIWWKIWCGPFFYDQPNKRRCNQITMGLLLLQLLNHMDRMETGTAAFDRELTGSVFNYIEEHYKNGSLSELAEIMGYDVYWLSREIKKRTGKTYKELLQSRRDAAGSISVEEQQASGGRYYRVSGI